MNKRTIKHALIGIGIIIALHLIFHFVRSSVAQKEIDDNIQKILLSNTEQKILIDKLSYEIIRKQEIISRIFAIQKEINIDKGMTEISSLKKLLQSEFVDNRFSFWSNFLVNFLYFILGGLVFIVFLRVFKFRKDLPEKKVE